MPRIHRQSSFHEYRPPKPEDGRLIGVSVTDPVELHEIAKAPYSEADYSRFAYSVCKSQLRTYVDEFIASFIENVPVESDDSTGFSLETALTTEQPVRCLVFNAFRSPLSAAQEFKFVTGTDLLGGIGVFSIFSKCGCLGDDSKKSLLGKVAQYSLESLNLCLGVMVAIVQSDSSWQLAIGQIHVHKHTNNNCASVRFALFDPAVFISSIFAKKSLKDVQHVSFNSFIPLSGDMSYYKSV